MQQERPESEIKLTTNHTTAAPPTATTAGSAEIELDTIRRMADGRLTVAFSCGDQRWEVRCAAAQVQKFDAFQRTVASKLGLWIRHACQSARRTRDQAELWQDELTYAFDAGADG